MNVVWVVAGRDRDIEYVRDPVRDRLHQHLACDEGEGGANRGVEAAAEPVVEGWRGDRASYRAGLQGFYDDLQEKGGTRHLMSNFEFALAGDRAAVRSYLSVFNRRSGAMLGIVEWQDEMERVAGTWKYKKRVQVA
jgi:hypothetical protein